MGKEEWCTGSPVKGNVTAAESRKGRAGRAARTVRTGTQAACMRRMDKAGFKPHLKAVHELGIPAVASFYISYNKENLRGPVV